jgi:hypothetical protein
LLDIVILSEPSIYPLKTGGVPHDDIVVVDVAGGCLDPGTVKASAVSWYDAV